jgi:hypothetical protein
MRRENQKKNKKIKITLEKMIPNKLPNTNEIDVNFFEDRPKTPGRTPTSGKDLSFYKLTDNNEDQSENEESENEESENEENEESENEDRSENEDQSENETNPFSILPIEESPWDILPKKKSNEIIQISKIVDPKIRLIQIMKKEPKNFKFFYNFNEEESKYIIAHFSNCFKLKNGKKKFIFLLKDFCKQYTLNFPNKKIIEILFENLCEPLVMTKFLELSGITLKGISGIRKSF